MRRQSVVARWTDVAGQAIAVRLTVRCYQKGVDGGEEAVQWSGTLGRCVTATVDAAAEGIWTPRQWRRGDRCESALHRWTEQHTDCGASRNTPPLLSVTQAARWVAPHGTRPAPAKHLVSQLPWPTDLPTSSRRA